MNFFKKLKLIFKPKSKKKDFNVFDDDLNLVKEGIENNDLKFFIQPYNISTNADDTLRGGSFPFS